jgi:serine/threonine-protein kinase
MADAGQSSLVGRTINSYEILEKLGAGGFGVVYKARDLKLDRIVALKFLPADIHSGEQSYSQFFKEARAASALDHPNVGTIHGIEETADGQPFIVMAYYDGETLSRRIRRGPLAPAHAVSIAAEMARGLAEAHSHNIVHRDVKPGNTIITLQGRIKIVDFGLARILQSATSTQTATITGTAAYMSPEQALGRLSDQRTDVWSLGVVLYEMLTGRLPFPGDNVPGILFGVTSAAPVPMGELPRELQQIVYRALAKDPTQRYQSAAEMAADLEALLPGGQDSSSGRTVTIKGFRKSVDSASQSVLTAPAPQAWRRWWPAFAAIPILAAAALFLLPSPRGRGPSAEKHIAVLPFINAGHNPASDALVDGLQESLTGRLSNLEVGNQALWVVPAAEVRRRGVADAAAARREFGANLVVSGSILRDERSVHLTVNLIDANSLRQLGSGVIEDRTGDLSVLQNDAITRLANLMGIRVNAETQRAAGGSVTPAAYEQYLKGLGALQRYDKPGNIDAAIREFESATAADPHAALAFAGLGEAYLLKNKLDQDPRWFEQADANCQRAVQLNDHLAPVYVTLGRIHTATGKQDLALQEFDHALQLEPRNADALFGQAAVFENLGRFQDAEQTLRRACALRPDYWDGYSKLALFYIRQHRYAEAERQFRRVIQLTPDNSAAWLNLGVALRNEDRVDEAIVAYRKSLELAPSYGAYNNLATLYTVQEKYAEATPLLEKALQLNENDYRLWINYANLCERLGRQQKAEEASRRALPRLEAEARLKPQDAGVQASLALLYVTLHDREKGLARLAMVEAMAPEDRDIMIRLAEAYEGAGNRARAVAWLNKALQHGSTPEKLQRIPELRPVLTDPNLKLHK